MKYRVMSRRLIEDTETVVEEQETLRTDRKTAEEDARIIRDILHRAAWIEEVQ